MVWNEYAHAAERMSDNEYTDDEEYEIELNKQLHIDDWGGHYDDDLWWMWNLLKRYVRDRYAEHHFLKDAKYHDFIEFCYRFSDHRAIEL